MMDIRVCVDCNNTLGEGPVWDVAEQRLYWIDGSSEEIWRCAPDGSDLRTWNLPSHIGSMALRSNGGAVLALESGLHLFDFDSGALELVAHPEEGLPGVRLNDGEVDSRGRFVVGSVDMDMVFERGEKKPRGSLYRLDTDLSLHVLEDAICISNNPCWSPDNKTFYFTDSSTDTMFAYDWDEAQGIPNNKRTFVQMGEREIPDGGAVDEEGYIWSVTNGAFAGIGELRRYAPDGTLDRAIEMPTPKTTSLAFGGPDLDILFVTSLNLPTNIAQTPQDGKLFAVHGLGIRGLPQQRFGG